MNYPITDITAAKPRARSKRLHSTEAIAERLAPRGIELISEYRGGQLQATFRAKACGHTWRVTASSVITSNSGCPLCANARCGERVREDVRLIREKTK